MAAAKTPDHLDMRLQAARLTAILKSPVTRAAVVILLLGLALLAVRRAPAYYYARRSRIGLTPIGVTDSVRDARGHVFPMLAPDSATFLFFVDTGCADCRLVAKSYAAFAKWAAMQQAGTRLLLPTQSGAASEFDQLSGAQDVAVEIPRRWYGRLGIRQTPTVLLFDRRGAIRGRWIGWSPQRWDAMSVMEYIER
jgi:hypothetical protein